MFILFSYSDTNYVQSNCSDGDMRLKGGPNEYEGRVEICINQVWGTICSGSSRYSRWGVTDGRVVCKQLGHQEFGQFLHELWDVVRTAVS